MSQNETEDLLQQIVELKRQNLNLQTYVDQIRPHFRIWNCNKCGQIRRFKDEAPTNKVMCELCDLEMRPYAIVQYRELKEQYDELDYKHSTALAERNRYAKQIQELVPLLAEFGYTVEENNIAEFLKQQLTYIKNLENAAAKLE